jgi:hypothetical protein
MVSKEYQNALDVITRNFQVIGNDLMTISNISSDFSYKDSNSEITLLKQIRNQLDEGIILLDLNNFRGMNMKFQSAGKKLDDIAELIRKEIHEPLGSLNKFEGAFTNENSEASSKPNVVNQIFSLARDINSLNLDVSNRVEELLKLSVRLNSFDNMESWGSQLEQDRIKLMVNISRILDALDKDNEDLDNVLIQNRDLNNYILEKIGNVINKVDYYNYFENIVEQVINHLNRINFKLRQDSPDDSLENLADNLKEIKTTYTMESQRIVHDKVVSGNNGNDISSPGKKEDEIEFF